MYIKMNYIINICNIYSYKNSTGEIEKNAGFILQIVRKEERFYM